MPFMVKVENFQSIKSATIQVEGFTVVHGPNNSGKSALHRALTGLAQNTKGTAFVRDGASKMRVTVEFPDTKITWEKGRSTKPAYTVNGGAPLHPGQGVPDEVREALRISPLKLTGGREIWPQIAPQFTGQVFMLDLPGSVMAEAIADVDRVGQLNEALRLAQSDKRQADGELKVRLQDRDRAQLALEDLKGLDEVEKETAAIEGVIILAQRFEVAIAGLSELQIRRDVAQQRVVSLSGAEEVVVPPSLETEQILVDLEALAGLQKRQMQATDRVARLSGIEAADLNPDGTAAERALAALTILDGFREHLTKAQQGVQSLESQLQEVQKQTIVAEEQVTKDLAELGFCPVCGSDTHKACAEDALL